MQYDVTTNVADVEPTSGNSDESSEMLSNYRGGTTASARVLYKRLQIGKMISGAVGKYTKPKKSGTVLVGFWVRSVDLVVLASD